MMFLFLRRNTFHTDIFQNNIALILLMLIKKIKVCLRLKKRGPCSLVKSNSIHQSNVNNNFCKELDFIYLESVMTDLYSININLN